MDSNAFRICMLHWYGMVLTSEVHVRTLRGQSRFLNPDERIRSQASEYLSGSYNPSSVVDPGFSRGNAKH